MNQQTEGKCCYCDFEGGSLCSKVFFKRNDERNYTDSVCVCVCVCVYRPTERERTERLIKMRLREIMMQKDLENVTCKEVRGLKMKE